MKKARKTEEKSMLCTEGSFANCWANEKVVLNNFDPEFQLEFLQFIYNYSNI